MAISRKTRFLAVALLGVSLTDFVIAPAARAIVGAPLTPVSYAGVARRTTRRVVVASSASASAAASQTAAANQAAAQSAAAASKSAEASAAAAQSAAATAQSAAAKPPAASPAPSSVVASLPDGCVSAGEVFRCGSVSYKPYMQGGTVVYAVVPGQ